MVIGPSGVVGVRALKLVVMEFKQELETVIIHNHQMEVHFALEVVQKKFHVVQQYLATLVNYNLCCCDSKQVSSILLFHKI
jgi:hypothetical protein